MPTLLLALLLVLAACAREPAVQQDLDEVDDVQDDAPEDDAPEDDDPEATPEDESIADGDPIRIGFLSVFSGRAAFVGETALAGAEMAIEEINTAGGVLGRPLEIIHRDTGAVPEDAARLARELILEDEVDFVIDASTSAEVFAAAEVMDDLNRLHLVVTSEAESLTYPENLKPLLVRAVRSSLHDGPAAGAYAATNAHIERWATLDPDYAYGRDIHGRFVSTLTQENPNAEVVVELFPPLGEADYTPLIQRVLDSGAEGLWTSLFGGDLIAFIEQAQPFNLFDEVEVFILNLPEGPVLDVLGDDMPAGLHSGNRFGRGCPNTDRNIEFYDGYVDRFGELPTMYTLEGHTGVTLLSHAIEQVGVLDDESVAEELLGLTVTDTPWGDLHIRAEDHTLVDFAICWGITDPSQDYPIVWQFEADWDQLVDWE